MIILVVVFLALYITATWIFWRNAPLSVFWPIISIFSFTSTWRILMGEEPLPAEELYGHHRGLHELGAPSQDQRIC